MLLYPNAKINLGLDIINKRNDGYHDISSIFYPLYYLYDFLEIIPSSSFSFLSSGIKIPGDKNICIKAFELLQSEYNIQDVHIHLHKIIPIGGGLGGGSSDGAFTLIALNKIFNLDLSNKELEDFALELGADCPFFIHNQSRYIEGKGDKMQKLALDLSDYNIEIFDSGIHISTAEAYSCIKPKKPLEKLTKLINLPIDNWKDRIKNDFEEYIFRSHPELAQQKENFYQRGAVYSAMSGTGSVIFGIFKKE